MAFIYTGMVKMEEVMMPFMQIGVNQTLFEKYERKGIRFLTDGGRQEKED